MNGRCGCGDGFTEELKLLLDEQADDARLARHRLGGAEGAGVLAVGGAEGVVDVDVAELGQLLGEVGIVLFFFLVKAEVFQQQDFAVRSVGGGLFHFRTDAIVGKRHGL